MKAVVPQCVLHNFPSTSIRERKARQKEILRLRSSSFEEMPVSKHPGDSSFKPFNPSLDSTPVPPRPAQGWLSLEDLAHGGENHCRDSISSISSISVVKELMRMPSLRDDCEVMKSSCSNSIPDFDSFQSPVMSPQISPRRKDPAINQEEEDTLQAPDSFRRKEAPDSFSISSKDKLTSHHVNKNKTRSRKKNSKGDGQKDVRPQLESADQAVERCNSKQRCRQVQPRLIGKDVLFQMLP